MDGQRMREGFRDNESRKPFSPCRWAAFLPYLILFPKSVSKQVLMSYPHSPVPSELGANLKISIVLAKKVLRRVPKRISQMVSQMVSQWVSQKNLKIDKQLIL